MENIGKSWKAAIPASAPAVDTSNRIEEHLALREFQDAEAQSFFHGLKTSLLSDGVASSIERGTLSVGIPVSVDALGSPEIFSEFRMWLRDSGLDVVIVKLRDDQFDEAEKPGLVLSFFPLPGA